MNMLFLLKYKILIKYYKYLNLALKNKKIARK
jgi:hypothetical protein